MDIVKILSSDGSVPISIAALVAQLAVLGVSFYWFRKAFEANRQRIDKELDEIRQEVRLQSKENHEIKEKVVEMWTDIKWIKQTLSKK